jgi:hypothetical protein
MPKIFANTPAAPTAGTAGESFRGPYGSPWNSRAKTFAPYYKKNWTANDVVRFSEGIKKKGEIEVGRLGKFDPKRIEKTGFQVIFEVNASEELLARKYNVLATIDTYSGGESCFLFWCNMEKDVSLNSLWLKVAEENINVIGAPVIVIAVTDSTLFSDASASHYGIGGSWNIVEGGSGNTAGGVAPTISRGKTTHVPRAFPYSGILAAEIRR